MALRHLAQGQEGKLAHIVSVTHQGLVGNRGICYIWVTMGVYGDYIRVIITSYSLLSTSEVIAAPALKVRMVEVEVQCGLWKYEAMSSILHLRFGFGFRSLNP